MIFKNYLLTEKLYVRIGLISNQAASLINFRGTLIKALNNDGHTVYALAPDFSEELRSKVKLLGGIPIDYSLARVGVNPAIDLFDFIKIIALLKGLKLDSVMGYSIKPVIYGTLAASIIGIKTRVAMIEGLGFVFTESNVKMSTKRKILRFIVAFLYKLSLKKAHKVVFLNQDDIDEFSLNGLVEKPKVVCLGGIGVDLDEWVEPNLACSVSPITFILVARLLREKGIIEYAEAATKIKEKYPLVQFFLLGAIDSNPGGLKQIDVESWVNKGVLTWLGHVSVKPWLSRSSVFVLPSYREGVPRSTQEAMAMGKAIITTDVPGCRDTVIHLKNGILIPPRDVNSLVDAMEKFIKQPDLILRMGIESRALAEERFDAKSKDLTLINLMCNRT